MHYYYYYMLLYYYTILRPHSSFLIISCIGKSFPGGSDGKESACNAGGLGSIPELGRSPGEGNGNPLQNSPLENSHGQRSLVGYSPWGHKESDMTGHTDTHTHTQYSEGPSISWSS